MRLKSFSAKSLPEAMGLVRDALGPDAVILSSQPDETGAGVRITAALEESALEELHFGTGPTRAVDLDAIAEALSYHRIPAGLFDRLVAVATTLEAEDNVMALAGALDAELAFGSLPAPLEPRPVMLVGPPGAGKSASAAKLCARARLAGRATAIITMDSAKSGGLAQAETFARALEAELLQAEAPAALGDAVAACGGERFIALDTAGANPFDEGDLERLAQAGQAAGAATILVLPAGGDAAESAETAAAFAGVGARAMIATRLDTSRRLGGLVSAMAASRLALLAASASPHIGEPLRPITPVALARMFLPAAADEPAETEHGDLGQWAKL